MSKEVPNIMIVEDQAVLAYDLLDRLKEFGFNQLMGPYKSGEKALIACEEDMPDIAILDIRLAGKMDGIKLAKELNSRSDVFIIYLTQQEDEETFNASSETEHIAYINKPFTNNEIRSALLRAVKRLDLVESSQPNIKRETPKQADKDDLKVLNDRIFFRSGTKRVMILLDDILYIKSNTGESGAKFIVTEASKIKNEQYITSFGLNVLEEKLIFYKKMVRSSRFHIVNLHHLKLIEDGNRNNSKNAPKKLVIGNDQLEVSDKYRKQVMDRLHIL